MAGGAIGGKTIAARTKTSRHVRKGQHDSYQSPPSSIQLRGRLCMYVGCVRSWFPSLATAGGIRKITRTVPVAPGKVLDVPKKCIRKTSLPGKINSTKTISTQI